MSIVRASKAKNYTVMNNYHLRNKEISLKAKGLLSHILSLPDDWNYSVSGLVAILKEGRTSVQNALKELEEAGYLIRTRVNGEKGRFRYNYEFFENPDEILHESPQTEDPFTVEDEQINTKEINIYYEEKKKEEQEEMNKKQNKNNEFEVEYTVVDDFPYLETSKEEENRHLKAEKKEGAESLPLKKQCHINYTLQEEKKQEEINEDQNKKSLKEGLSTVDTLHSDANEEEYDIFEDSGKSPQTEDPFTVETEQINTKEISIYYEERKKEEREKNKSSYQLQAKNYKTYNEIIEGYTNNEELRNELKESLRVRKMKRAPLTNRALEINLEKLDKLSCNEKEKIEIVRETIANGWTTFYPLRKIYSNMQHNDVTGSKSSAYNIEEYDLLSAFD